MEPRLCDLDPADVGYRAYCALQSYLDANPDLRELPLADVADMCAADLDARGDAPTRLPDFLASWVDEHATPTARRLRTLARSLRDAE